MTAAGKKVQPNPIVTDKPDLDQNDTEEIPGLYPSCAVDLWVNRKKMMK